MDVGSLIKSARLAKGLTQEELGRIVGVQKYAIAKYENGRVVNIKRSTLLKLAVALEIKPSSLIEGEIENPAVQDGEITGNRKALMDFASTVPEEKAGKVLQAMKAILAIEQ